jgi:hypothetical protein
MPSREVWWLSFAMLIATLVFVIITAAHVGAI